MSDSYSKVTCPNCGVNIEYPTDYQLASVPCPNCSKIVPLSGKKDVATPPSPPTQATPPSKPPEPPARMKRDTIAIVITITCATVVLALMLKRPVAWEYRMDVQEGPSANNSGENRFAGHLMDYAGDSGWELVAAWPIAGETKKIGVLFKRPCAKKSDAELERDGKYAIEEIIRMREKERK